MVNNSPKLNQAGFSTLEMLMAMFVLLLALTAVVTVSFGNQSMIISGRTNAEALNIAQGLLEKAQADARKDFNLVNPYAAKSPDNFYDEVVTVTHPIDSDTHQPDYFTKLVTATIGWTGEFNRPLKVSLSALVTNFNNAVGGDTCSSLLGDVDRITGKLNYDPASWKNPEIRDQDSVCSRIGAAVNCPITDVDAYNDKLYVAIGDGDATSTPTLLVYDIDSENRKITFNKAIDNSGNKAGINAVAVAKDPATQINYAYIANASIESPLQIIDLDNMEVKDVPTLAITGHAAANNIFYRNGYVYLGLKTGNGPEFSIVDVHDPLAASEIGHWSSGGSINSIYVGGNYAYLAVANDKKPIVLDISDPTTPVEESKIIDYGDASNNNGKSVAMVGDTLYFGRVWDVGVAGNKLYVLDAGDPATSTWPILGYDPSIDKSVDGLIVRGKTSDNNSAGYPALVFALTPQYMKTLDVTNNGSVAEWGNLSFDSSITGSNYEPVFDCEGNAFFVGSNDNDDKGYISIIAPD